MHAKKLLHNLLQNACPKMHQYRFNSLASCCEGLLFGQKLTVTDIGRSISSNISAKHNIKRADRLLSNIHLQQETFLLYQSSSSCFVENAPRPLILVERSDLTSTRSHYLLRASLALNGRPVTLYEEVHTQADGRETHQQFLNKLKQLFPENAKPIIVADAGFRGTWFIQVEALGWDWVGRIRGNSLCANPLSIQWFSCKTLLLKARSLVKDFGGNARF